MPWYKVLPAAATVVCIILIKPGLTAGMDFGLQSSNSRAARSAIMIPEIAPRQAQNVFVNPAGDPSDTDFSNNPVYEVDTVVNVEWIMDGTITDEVSLFLSVGINTSYAPAPQAIKRNPSGQYFEWTVVNAFGALSQMFQLSIRIESNGTILFMSRIFNVSVTTTSGNSPDISSGSSPSDASAVLSVAAGLIASTSTSEDPASEISSTAILSATSSSPDSSLTTSAANDESTALPTGATTPTPTSNSFFPVTSIPYTTTLGPKSGLPTTLISRTSTLTSIVPGTTAISSSQSKNTDSNSPKRAEIALGCVLGIVLLSVAAMYLFRYLKTRPQPFKTPSILLLFKRTAFPTNDAKIIAEKPPPRLKRTRNIPELEGKPIVRAELDGGPREPAELDGRSFKSRSMISRVQSMAKTVCPWRGSK